MLHATMQAAWTVLSRDRLIRKCHTHQVVWLNGCRHDIESLLWFVPLHHDHSVVAMVLRQAGR
jgi:hypothetical protein